MFCDNQKFHYTYLIGWLLLDYWYYGLRSTPILPEDDLWKNYFTSSNEVKEFRKYHGDPDIKEIRKLFVSRNDAEKWEYKVLKRLEVASNGKWLNKCSYALPPRRDLHGANCSAYGTIWIHNEDGQHKRIKLQKFATFQNFGWATGRLISDKQKKIMMLSRNVDRDSKTGRFIKGL